MSNSILKSAVLATAVVSWSVPALAFDWKACDAEIKKNCPEAKRDHDIFECLEKVEKTLSKPCYDTHEKYEKETGKGADKD